MKKYKKRDLKKGTLFWITGLSGSGKTTIAKKIKKDIQNLYGPTLLISGDDIRKISFAFVDSVPAAVPVPVPDVLSCAVATTTSGTAPGIPGT